MFFELSAEKYWGSVGKWLVIISIQVFKWVLYYLNGSCAHFFCSRCISRILLIYRYKESIIQHPPVPILDRKNVKNLDYSINNTIPNTETTSVDTISFILTRSGRVVRKVDSSPPTTFRSWKGLECKQGGYNKDQSIQQACRNKQLVAETLYVIKPVVHLGTVVCFGNNTWKPWLISLLLDCYRWHFRLPNIIANNWDMFMFQLTSLQKMSNNGS